VTRIGPHNLPQPRPTPGYEWTGVEGECTPSALPGELVITGNMVTVGELVAAFPLPEPLPDGRHLLRIDKVTGEGGRIRIAVSNTKHEVAEIPLGRLGDKRTLGRHLRFLLGRTDLETLAEIREALDGKSFNARVGTREYMGRSYRTIN
jgi:hypothetical protein